MASAADRVKRVAAAAAWMIGLALAPAGCASMQVSSYGIRDLDLGSYRTYEWGPAEERPTGDPRLDSNPFFDERVRLQVEEGLAARGFVKATAGSPDLLVHYHANVTQEIDVRDFDRAAGYCEGADCRPFVYDAGTLFVDLMDARTGKLLWRGWAESSIDGVIDDQELMEARIDAAVAQILERLPHGPSGRVPASP